MRGPESGIGVYVLELAGTDDAFAAAEAAAVLGGVQTIAPGLATAQTIAGLDRLAFTHRASKRLAGSAATVEDARAALREATIDRARTSAAVRAVDVRGTTGVDTQRAERALGAVLVDAGFEIDLEEPDHELRALFAGDRGVLGWLAGETPRGYDRRRPTDRPFFQPGSMDPMLARAVVNMAGAGPGRRVLDPMCGTGGILIEAALAGADVLGLDSQAKMAAGTRENLAAVADIAQPTVLRGDAGRLPLGSGTVDCVAFDAPYGRQSPIEGELETLVADALGEARRVADRGVIVADRPWHAAAERAGWAVTAEFERRVHRSLSRYVLLLR